MHSFASGFLHSTLCLWVIHAFACSCNILIYIALYISLCEYTTIYPLMNIWVVSNLKQLANNVAMNILSLTFSIYVHTFLLDVFLKIKFGGHEQCSINLTYYICEFPINIPCTLNIGWLLCYLLFICMCCIYSGC